MAVRELRKYEFSCDGYRRHDGGKCTVVHTIEGYNPIDAEIRLNEARFWNGPNDWKWIHSAQGWLCPKTPHRNDPRLRCSAPQ